MPPSSLLPVTTTWRKRAPRRNAVTIVQTQWGKLDQQVDELAMDVCCYLCLSFHRRIRT